MPSSFSRLMLTAEGCAGTGGRGHFCRAGYLGDDDWAFALYNLAAEDYTDAVLTTGHYAGHPDDAYDTAAITHLTDYKK